MMVKIISKIFFAEKWTAGKQILSVILLFAFVIPILLLYVYKSAIIGFLKKILLE